VKNQKLIKRSFTGIGLALILLLCSFIFQIEANAQIKKITPPKINIAKILKSNTIVKDTLPKPPKIRIDPSKVKLNKLPIDTKTKSFLNTITKPIKFKDNRDKSEEKRIYLYLNKLINDSLLKIDPSTVKEIMVQLNAINTANKSTKLSIEATNDSIDSLVKLNNLDKKASKATVDSIKVQMSAVIQENANNNNQEKRVLKNKITELLKQFSDLKYCTSMLAAKDSIIKHDTLRYFKCCLNPKIQLIGWHSAEMKNEFKNYNYNYLSAINLYAYELSVTGKSKNQKEIQEFEKPNGVIKLAQSNGCDVHLTIHNDNPDEIAIFLNNPVARKTFYKEIDELIGNNKLKGINIYFDYIEESEPFVRFIKELYRNLKTINNSIKLNISIPAIRDDESLDEIAAYNFQELDSMVNCYLVLTDDLISLKTNLAQSSSPLYDSDKYGKRTIQSTIGFYGNLNIPKSKLIMTVSYTGIKWQVEDFQGTPLSHLSQGGETRTYAEIMNEYANGEVEGHNIIEGFDPDQVAAYYNITDLNTLIKEQIWFEDFRSLYQKYNWALENELGGVSIRGLGNDNGYSELWDVLGATLIKIDTTYLVEHTVHKISKVKKCLNIFTNALKGISLNTFEQDMMWASAVRLKYIDLENKKGYTRFDSIKFPDEQTIFDYMQNPIVWKNTPDYKPSVETDSQCYLTNLSQCYYLYTRWTIYATFFRWCGTIFLCLSVIFYLVTRYFERFKLGSAKVRTTIKIAQSIFFIIFIISTSFWVYLNPSFDSIGAGSNGTGIVLMFYMLFFGAFLGWIIHSWYAKNKHIPKNLP
jgi:spore germination protein YaaH